MAQIAAGRQLKSTASPIKSTPAPVAEAPKVSIYISFFIYYYFFINYLLLNI
jgi:hypothetical protein